MRPGVGGKVEQAGNSASLEAVARVGRSGEEERRPLQGPENSG